MDLCGWSTSGAGLGRARYFQTTGRSRTKPAILKSHAPSVGAGQRDSNLTGLRPGLVWILRIIFSLYACAVSPPARGFETATYSLAHVQRFFGQPRDVHNRRTKQSQPYAPIPVFECRWVACVTQCLDQAYSPQ